MSFWQMWEEGELWYFLLQCAGKDYIYFLSMNENPKLSRTLSPLKYLFVFSWLTHKGKQASRDNFMRLSSFLLQCGQKCYIFLFGMIKKLLDTLKPSIISKFLLFVVVGGVEGRGSIQKVALLSCFENYNSKMVKLFCIFKIIWQFKL